MVDFIIVGGGLAGMAFAETAWRNGKSVVVFDSRVSSASRAASGLYNPVVLKRLTAVSGAPAYLDAMEMFYSRLQERIGISFFHPTPILRKFNSVEEQNNWFVAADNQKLAPFLDPRLVYDKFNGIDSPFDYGKVNHSGWLDTKVMLDAFWRNVPAGSHYYREPFNYSGLTSRDGGVHYKTIDARHIVFAEGTGIERNPHFNHLPLQGTKGELLYIKAPQLSLGMIVNAGIFIIPMGDSVFKVGATYAWDDLNDVPTQAAKDELLAKLREILTVPYEVVDHIAGVRPTVRDRKPLLGTHPNDNRIHILNGLGTRGILLAPLLASQLYDSIENGIELPREVDIARFSAADPRSAQRD